MKELYKNRNREDYSFANINLLGKCNANCFFCLGKDIHSLLSKHNQINTHFNQWRNFDKFLSISKEKGIKKLYITGQNTDSLLYKYLSDLIQYIQEKGFKAGLRTNGVLAEKNIEIMNSCLDESGLSIQSLDPETNYKIMGVKTIPNWEKIIPQLRQPRVSVVINRYNAKEFIPILTFLSKFKNITYVQARRISTDTRCELLESDIDVYEKLFQYVDSSFPKEGEFFLAQRYSMFGMQVNFWRTIETSVNSMNYFTDGTISDNYFVVEGYLNNYQKEAA